MGILSAIGFGWKGHCREKPQEWWWAFGQNRIGGDISAKERNGKGF
jgi:hypothetical protein